MKIKIFTGNRDIEIEKAVNDFIKNVEVIKILQSESLCNELFSLTITVVYK